MWKYFALLSALFAALTAILAKLGLKGVPSNLATAIRCVVIVVMTWAVVGATGELPALKTLTRQNLLFLILSGVATGLSWLFYFRALATGPVSKVAPIDKLSLALTITLSAVILHEPLEPKTIFGGLLIVAGTLVLIR
ncbi:EamA family transporter [Puia sp.]|jgi:transporter family protein|uniref:EamA family transporter n=1 Tax=Puia sp. TaxID=2045100 RepID=UPI002F3F4611